MGLKDTQQQRQQNTLGKLIHTTELVGRGILKEGDGYW